MNNKSCPEEMENWAEKAFQDGVEIIYSLVRDVVTFRERLPFIYAYHVVVVTSRVFSKDRARWGG
ncbi:MAG: hypothetical protein LWX51_03265 [Deltaproteobacteria bacterium]|nr:hypothetical protein [Deltaproteobacteria bacterium]